MVATGSKYYIQSESSKRLRCCHDDSDASKVGLGSETIFQGRGVKFNITSDGSGGCTSTAYKNSVFKIQADNGRYLRISGGEVSEVQLSSGWTSSQVEKAKRWYFVKA